MQYRFYTAPRKRELRLKLQRCLCELSAAGVMRVWWLVWLFGCGGHQGAEGSKMGARQRQLTYRTPTQLKITKLLKPPDETMAQMRPTCKVQVQHSSVKGRETHTALFMCRMGAQPCASPHLSFDSSAAHISAAASIQKNIIEQQSSHANYKSFILFIKQQ